ncbi:patatin-like phospholipase domain-containing protein 2 [Amborella trichopoda]|uniref:Patatin n=1 Tax=Amborella trichopoda TaxID=13333 RepID=W1NHN9_AMBTC|nr:patatin-like phospholipase domain-containing protein 2 [Amborella trichopoda]ERM95307.1 hypothetical protein AMTR_s00008p00125700 [Amborella trichopoda]|eukprot:XP_006827891.3 patatin-like phospholipase domain-containing protein 2 [Amborella trichopoda]
MQRRIPLKFTIGPMISLAPLSSLPGGLSQRTLPALHPNQNPRLSLSTFSLSRIFSSKTLKVSAKSNQSTNKDNTAIGKETLPDKKSIELDGALSSGKKSFAVATGEIFLGLASALLKTRRESLKGSDSKTEVFVDFDKIEENGFLTDGKNGGVSSSVSEVPCIVWEQREKDIEAERTRPKVTSPGFSFSAAGLLFPYHLGVAQFLIEKGYILETTALAGSSAGAIVCAVIASGSCMQDGLRATKLLAEDCRANGTAFRLGAVLRSMLYDFLPNDVHIRSNGRIRVAVTQIFQKPRGLLVDQFDSKEDLINAVITSSFIPGYLAPRPVTLFRNRLCIDGGLTLFMPPTAAAKTVRVCAFPATRLGLTGIGISPDCNPVDRGTPRQLFQWALEPAEDYVLDKLYELGYQDAAVWAEQNPVELIVRDDNTSPETPPN